jgi:peptidoglycan/LPS O-acetylase OafA/YrhL
MAYKFKILADHTNSRINNFDLLRLFTALLVIYEHSFALTGSPTEPFFPFSHGLLVFGSFAVPSFFTISGFLITRSYLEHNNLFVFFTARILRIFPGLIATVLFCALIVGLLVTTLPKLNYLTDPAVYTYIKRNILLIGCYILPGVFTDNIYPLSVNGSLWTLSYEFALYVCVATVGVLGLLKRKYLTSVLALVGFIFFVYLVSHFYATNKFFNYLNRPVILQPLYCYILGMIAYLCRSKIVLHPLIAILLFVIAALMPNQVLYRSIIFLTLVYCLLLFAYSPLIKGYLITRYGDFSFGIYVYAFPVQQTLMHYFHFHYPMVLYFTTLPIALVLGMGSWFFIEKPTLKLKNKIPLLLSKLRRERGLREGEAA